MDKDNEDKQFFWHRRLLYTHGCLYTLVGKPYTNDIREYFIVKTFRELHAPSRDLCHPEVIKIQEIVHVASS